MLLVMLAGVMMNKVQHISLESDLESGFFTLYALFIWQKECG